ncbi:3-hydroxyacyl-CoA dehydrogenase NAD-binding domain-containing protein [Ruania halotolerans]|uniref:3-hydroxyacyl-CoA dehydrogenase NAD-binding domain-containing protein n=1 Tax=Ruania halotolerans TaxID=2897773 RepID=UPI001E369FCF|nr:3-hydroxyacyl-CoA dehydrogenase NAD-binding domain-containing protein [Ruania halotolerans]UFU04791.1 3-hydroxyacyl-CoA dehydrogenase NAD-binding domain-containing protein [Ruania halotolerans]
MSERITHSLIRDVTLEDLGTLALITLDNAAGPRKPNTLGPDGMAELRAALESVTTRAHAGEIAAVAITGKPFHFAAGADLHGAAEISNPVAARTIAEAGHDTFQLLSDMPVPTFAFIGGAALGGGLELALSCHYRTVSSAVRGIGLPEVFLGLIPGWGGTYLLPRLIGMERALTVIVENPLRQNTQLSGPEAARIGIADAVFDPADFIAESLRWSAQVVRGDDVPSRREPDDPDTARALVESARTDIRSRLHDAAPAPGRALDLLHLSAGGDRQECFEAENAALTDLICSPEFAASVYAFDLTTRRAKSPAGAPDAELARPVRSIGVAGAGLMASQLALLFARRMRLPVVMRDLDVIRTERGLQFVAEEVQKLVTKGRMSAAEGNRVRSLVSATTDLAELRHADLVIEAVFEELEVKKQVFAELEHVISPDTVLATNTSALSITAMAADLAHPERVVGLHFFNPVAQMPLVEVVRAERTDDSAYATAFAVAASCRKSAIAVADAPGFVVNRLLVRLLGEVLGSLEDGTDVRTADRALWPLGLPMGPFQLLQLVGPAVAGHVLDTLREQLGERYPTSPGLQAMIADGVPFVEFEGRPSASSPVDPTISRYFGSRPEVGGQDEAGLLQRVRDALAQEVDLMLAEGVVAEAADIDLGMILGAGWPFHLGGITPYLERTAGTP